ncbi:MAG: hypothetical protein IJ828_10950 [Treponema sp.]|nr:hypothetical protein [Treponema sp.]
MTDVQYQAFCEYRDKMKSLCGQWLALSDELRPLQVAAALKDTPEYPLETSVVYNKAYDEITKDSDIKLIVIGDNPGKEEQLSANNRYLVGQSGRIAEGFFRRNPELGIDFRKNVVIMNKTPVHTAKTTHLKYLAAHGSDRVKRLLHESQLDMARLAAELHQKLETAQLWLVGYSELKGKGLFLQYRDALLQCYRNADGSMKESWDSVFVFQHFSMNRFLIDLSQHQKEESASALLSDALAFIGSKHRKEIFGGI